MKQVLEVMIIGTCVALIALSPTAQAMTGAGHALGGAALGRTAGSPEGAFVVGLASHSLLDAVPHKEVGLLAQSVLFLGAAAVIHREYTLSGDTRVVAGAVGGFLPDVEHLLYRLGLMKRRVYSSHSGALPHGNTRSSWVGLWLEGGIVGGLVALGF